MYFKVPIIMKRRQELRVAQWVNLFHPSVAFHIETSHLLCRVKQMAGFYMKRNIVLKWVKTLPVSYPTGC